jgi:acetyl-CoA carboxylase carboxyl transferase subunit beta
MTFKNLFKNHNNTLEGIVRAINNRPDDAVGAIINRPYPPLSAPIRPDNTTTCPKCKKDVSRSAIIKNHHVCVECGFYFKIPARQRINFITDKGSFTEFYSDMKPSNLLGFPEYDEKLKTAAQKSGEKEAVLCGTATISGCETCIFIMDPLFMMGSMGTVVGEKITRLFEYAAEHSLPVVGYTVSGGARMQEGVLSLMQMAKTAGAVKRHSDKGLLYVTVLTDPTTGGVTASFAMLGDIIIAEPNALICFAGPRVIEQTIRQKLPEDFQHAEFLYKKGSLDDIIERKNQFEYLSTILKIHAKRGDGVVGL